MTRLVRPRVFGPFALEEHFVRPRVNGPNTLGQTPTLSPPLEKESERLATRHVWTIFVSTQALQELLPRWQLRSEARGSGLEAEHGRLWHPNEIKRIRR